MTHKKHAKQGKKWAGLSAIIFARVLALKLISLEDESVTDLIPFKCEYRSVMPLRLHITFVFFCVLQHSYLSISTI